MGFGTWRRLDSFCFDRLSEGRCARALLPTRARRVRPADPRGDARGAARLAGPRCAARGPGESDRGRLEAGGHGGRPAGHTGHDPSRRCHAAARHTYASRRDAADIADRGSETVASDLRGIPRRAAVVGTSSKRGSLHGRAGGGSRVRRTSAPCERTPPQDRLGGQGAPARAHPGCLRRARVLQGTHQRERDGDRCRSRGLARRLLPDLPGPRRGPPRRPGADLRSARRPEREQLLCLLVGLARPCVGERPRVLELPRRRSSPLQPRVR